MSYMSLLIRSIFDHIRKKITFLTDTGENVQKWTRVFSTRRWVILVARTSRKKKRRKYSRPLLDVLACGQVSSPRLYRLTFGRKISSKFSKRHMTARQDSYVLTYEMRICVPQLPVVLACSHLLKSWSRFMIGVLVAKCEILKTSAHYCNPVQWVNQFRHLNDKMTNTPCITSYKLWPSG